MKTKTKKIVFRVEETLFDFIGKTSKENDMTMSELIRNVLIYWHMDYLLGGVRKPFSVLQNQFFKQFSSGKKVKAFYKTKRIVPLKGVIK